MEFSLKFSQKQHLKLFSQDHTSLQIKYNFCWNIHNCPFTMVCVVKSADTDNGGHFISAVDKILLSGDENTWRVAFDCEGIRLSRVGTVDLVSICLSTMEVFLVDFGGDACPQILKKVKELFESENVTKIIHDCRMDCDALFHIHGIKVNNVHDTSCFHYMIMGNDATSLNDVPRFNSIEQNSIRSNGVYNLNPRFWSTRPLTKEMVKWASSDVGRLFHLAASQLTHLSSASKKICVH